MLPLLTNCLLLVPKQPAGCGTAFLKFLPATQDDYATVSVAVRIALNGNGTVAAARVALGAAAMVPVGARAVEAVLSGKAAGEKTFQEAASLVLNTIDRIADFRGPAEYKRKMAVVHVRRALAKASAKSQTPSLTRHAPRRRPRSCRPSVRARESNYAFLRTPARRDYARELHRQWSRRSNIISDNNPSRVL
jgi:CO dehydrogenase flavoprotein C-terminal domain